MRSWILCALVIVALVACFQLAEAKPAVSMDRADKEVESRPRRHRRKKGGKHGPGRSKLNQHRPKRRRFKRPRSVEEDRKRGKKCANGKRGKNCNRQ